MTPASPPSSKMTPGKQSFSCDREPRRRPRRRYPKPILVVAGGAIMTGSTGMDLSHLHPGIRTIAQADDATRLHAIRSKRWVTHQPAQRVLETLKEAFDQPPGDRMENVLLLAESGMGKTMLLRKFQRDHAKAFDTVEGIRPYPVVFALMPEEPSEEAFLIQILKAIEAPFDLSRRRHRLDIRETTFRIVREVGTRMLMIDEINSVLVSSPRQQRHFLQLLRFLSNELQVAIVCAGVPEARFALRSDPQLRSRAVDVELLPWTEGPELRAFVALLVQGLPLRYPSPVDSPQLRRLLVERSGGITLSLCRALERAGAAAIRNGRDFIDLASLQDLAVWDGMRQKSPIGPLRPSTLSRSQSAPGS
jgi:hypothetical protein